MKGNLTIVVVLSLMFSGCVSNNNWGGTEQTEIKMGAVGKMANKAIVEGAVFPDGFDFTVYGFYTTDSFATTPSQFEMYDVDCTKQGDYYKNDSQSYYWPWFGEVGFYAVSPASLTPTLNWDTGVMLTNYTVVDAEDVDVMIAYNKGSNQVAALNMVFFHALSQVEVLANTKEAYTNVSIAITDITFKNIDVVATCIYKELSPNNTIANPSIIWVGNADSKDSEVYSNEDQTVVYDNSVAQPYGTGIVVIPQEMDPASVISIGYTLTQNGNTINGRVDAPINTNWNAGYKYVYTIIFALDKISFDPSAMEWVTVTTNIISIE